MGTPLERYTKSSRKWWIPGAVGRVWGGIEIVAFLQGNETRLMEKSAGTERKEAKIELHYES